MINNIIAACPKHTAYSNHVFRIVETQEYAATTKIVDDLSEQHLLEQLLDEVKPAYRPATEELHYLISTPFRYPPLKYGSRFGDITMPSYFYGAEQISTVLAECAFYRFVFLHDMATPYEGTIQSEHSIFSVKVSTTRCSDLTKLAEQDHLSAISAATSYQTSQAIGKHLTQQKGTEVIRFYSARDTHGMNQDMERGVNLAIATPDAIKSKKPEQMQLWLCQTNNESVTFSTQGQQPSIFSRETFLLDGQLAKPF
ncbi:RES family NAD+ phosphorylase [Thalassotalea euphylliae]|uniref:RES domain-containing protein n=1 Tax=Thalassotalea euphylliae TaxID=1655234 RepID=A0A3E0UFQ3_9GAMM|nr:RES family NAD+ phosphorylase [Thalassotalea euphylliae]REL35686.1 RES domain-containing protein [Thalassotalea euphylliae]